MADSLRLEEQRVDQVTVGIRAHIQGLAAVKEEWDLHVLIRTLLLERNELWNKVLDGPPLGLFADEVEAYPGVSVSALARGYLFAHPRSTVATSS